MKTNNTLQKLLDFEPTGFPFISLYLNTEPNETGHFNFDVFVKKETQARASDFEANSSERESFDRDAERIGKYLEDIREDAKGAAIFACAGAGDFFEARVFDVPFHENFFFVFEKPHIFPLARLIAQNPIFAVVQADTNAANIFVCKRGNIVDSEEIQNVKTNRTEVGGWSQARYQRSVDNFHQQHAKEVVAELEKIARNDGIEEIVLAGDEAVIIPLLRAEMSKELDEKIVEALPLGIDAPAHEVLEAAERAINRHQTLVDQRQVDNLFEQDYDDGFGVTGVEKTLAALANGQVQELYVSANFDRIKYDANEVAEILRAYQSDEAADARNPGMLIDEILRRAVDQVDNIRFIKDENLLKEVGGIGALLRYKIAKGQKV